MPDYLLAIDQGTSSSRVIIFSRASDALSMHQIDLVQSYPKEGWVEQNPIEIWQNTLECMRQALKKINLSAKQIAAIGISNQRETTILWDKNTGVPIYPAIVWQDRRTAAHCKKLMTHPIAKQLQSKTGLIIDPYFSATKIAWILDHVPYARERALKGEIAFGTVDTFLLWHLTNGQVHVTDATNASRTMLFNIQTQQWDDEILQALQIPASILPVVKDCSADFGVTDKALLGAAIPICGVAGDQQAATVGQACFSAGMMKATLGTGCFMLLNTGQQIIHSNNRLLTTIAYRLENTVTYGLEGSIFAAGVTVKWLRDSLKLFHAASDTEGLANSVADNGGVYLVPAFTGLGAPYWAPDARGAILGLSRNSSSAHIVRAGLEAVCYQARDLLAAMQKDGVDALTSLRVDGGMAANNWLLQFLADQLNLRVERPNCIETSALGAAYLAGLRVGLYSSLDEIANLWQCNAQFNPMMEPTQRDALYHGWLSAVEKVLMKSR